MCLQSRKTFELVTHTARKMNVQFSQPCGVSVNYHDKLKWRYYPSGAIRRSYPTSFLCANGHVYESVCVCVWNRKFNH
jgi:hypothetical protein